MHINRGEIDVKTLVGQVLYSLKRFHLHWGLWGLWRKLKLLWNPCETMWNHVKPILNLIASLDTLATASRRSSATCDQISSQAIHFWPSYGQSKNMQMSAKWSIWSGPSIVSPKNSTSQLVQYFCQASLGNNSAMETEQSRHLWTTWSSIKHLVKSLLKNLDENVLNYRRH